MDEERKEDGKKWIKQERIDKINSRSSFTELFHWVILHFIFYSIYWNIVRLAISLWDYEWNWVKHTFLASPTSKLHFYMHFIKFHSYCNPDVSHQNPFTGTFFIKLPFNWELLWNFTFLPHFCAQLLSQCLF